MEFQLNLFIEDMPKKRREYDHFPTNKHRQHLARLRGLEVSAVTGEYVLPGLGNADVAIATGEMLQLIPDLVEALGGELEIAA